MDPLRAEECTKLAHHGTRMEQDRLKAAGPSIASNPEADEIGISTAQLCRLKGVRKLEKRVDGHVGSTLVIFSPTFFSSWPAPSGRCWFWIMLSSADSPLAVGVKARHGMTGRDWAWA